MSEVATTAAVIVDFIESNTSSDDRDEVMQGVLDQLRRRGKVKGFEHTTVEVRPSIGETNHDYFISEDLRRLDRLTSEGWSIVSVVAISTNPFSLSRVHYTLQRPRFR